MKLNFLKKLSLFFLSACILWTCERDDICAESTATTPRLVLEFFDISNQTESKNVPNLRVQGVGNNFPLADVNIETTNRVLLPLKTNENSTSFLFHRDYGIDDNGTPDDTTDDTITGNEDVITVTYTREDVYVSRACGYKTIFRNVAITIEDDGDRWISLIQSATDNQSVEDETTIHFNFFH
ncbi:DUF6452 family protein [uncultured Psychroserpens sp.]|uniref:DUF6452 family protein n=1 Tax=uncultured Psychroserpens sp. TaxID=255436 RepID=UPI002605C291|nr:DUF6452 family protein [uncultured Psychroserpens sp.]